MFFEKKYQNLISIGSNRLFSLLRSTDRHTPKNIDQIGIIVMNFYLKYCLELRRARMFSTQKEGKHYEIQKMLQPPPEMKTCQYMKGKNSIFFLKLDLFILDFFFEI